MARSPCTTGANADSEHPLAHSLGTCASRERRQLAVGFGRLFLWMRTDAPKRRAVCIGDLGWLPVLHAAHVLDRLDARLAAVVEGFRGADGLPSGGSEFPEFSKSRF